MSSPDSTIEELLGTSRTTRCANAYFRQKQLKSLHDVLRNKIVDLRLAIKQDTGATDAEITTEIATVLNIIKEHYAGIDPKKELEEEYRVTKRKDADDRKIAYGVVYIEPLLRHTPFFNCVVPLCVALAAGNCVALRVSSITASLRSRMHKRSRITDMEISWIERRSSYNLSFAHSSHKLLNQTLSRSSHPAPPQRRSNNASPFSKPRLSQWP